MNLLRSSLPLRSFLAFAFATALVPLAAQQAPVAAPATNATAPHDQLLAVLWMQRGAEYRAACLQAYNTALLQLPQALAEPNWTACLEQAGQPDLHALPPAVIVDVDETVLDNSAFAARQIRAGVTKFDAAAWSAWVHEQQALPIPGALPFLHGAAQLDVRVVYVTNRRKDSAVAPVCTEEGDTRKNLARLGFPIVEGEGEDVVLCAGEVGDKAARRAEVAKRFRIVQIVGDNLGDFAPGTEPKKQELPHGLATECRTTEQARNGTVTDFTSWWGQRWFLIPNPCYGGWETVLRGQHDDLQEALRLQR